MPTPLAGGEGSGARWYRIAARPLPAANRRRALTAWTLADISARARPAGNGVPGAAARHRLSRPRAGRLLLGRARRAHRLPERDAGRMARHRPRRASSAGALTLADIVRGDGVALLAGVAGRRRAANRTDVIDLDLVKRNGQSLPVRLLHRVPVAARRRAGRDAHAWCSTARPARRSRKRCAPPRCASPASSTTRPSPSPRSTARAASGAPMRRSCACSRAVAAATAPARGSSTSSPSRTGRTVAAALAAAARRARASSRRSMPRIAGERRAQRRASTSTPVDEGAGGSEIGDRQRHRHHRAAGAGAAVRARARRWRAVGQLAGGIAHDFNNVLTAIIGFSDLLLANHRPSDPSFQDIMNIKQNANRAAGLVRQLLAFSRRQTLRPQVLTLSATCSPTSPSCSQRLLGENVKLERRPRPRPVAGQGRPQPVRAGHRQSRRQRAATPCRRAAR